MESPRKLKHPNMDPPSGWRFHDKESGAVIEAGHLQGLINDVRIFLRRNNREIPSDLAEIVEDYVCGFAPKSMLKSGKPNKVMFTVTMLWSGTQLIMDAVIHGKRFTTQEESERRALICANCPKNVRHAACLGCKGLYGIIKMWYGNRTTSFDQNLFMCEICGCLNTAQMHAPEDVLRKITPKRLYEKYPSQGCWKYDVLHKEKSHAAE